MGILRSMMFGGMRSLARSSAHTKARNVAAPGAGSFQKLTDIQEELRKTSSDIWNARGDINRAAGDLYRQGSQNTQQVMDKLAKLQELSDRHGESIKEILHVLKQMSGLG